MEGILQEARTANLVWIGEIHGIKENYLAYKVLLPSLFSIGFKDLLWEMPTAFSQTSKNSEDGKINPYARDFLHWLDDQKNHGSLSSYSFFGQIYEFSDYEKAMSDQLIDILGKSSTKTIILTGNYHLQNSTIKSAQEHLSENTNLKILKVELVYSGGCFYNYGVKEIKKRKDQDSLNFGAISKRDNTYLFHVGEVHAVFENPAAN